MAANLVNIQSAVEYQLNDINSKSSSLSSNQAQWLSEIKNDLESRVETTKENITKYDYEGIIGKLGQDYKVDPKLLWAIICNESNGVPDVVNEFGYSGCMQVPADRVSFTSDQKGNAQQGIEAGIDIISKKFPVVSNNIMLTIMANNVGEGVVTEALSAANVTITDNLKWTDCIEIVAQYAANFYHMPSKLEEVGTCTARVMFIYAQIKNLKVKIGTLPLESSLGKPKNPKLGEAAANKTGVQETGVKPHSNHSDVILKPIPPDKTYCEPIYPDYTTTGTDIPTYAIPGNVPTTQMVMGKNDTNMTYQIPLSVLCYYSDSKDMAFFTAHNQNIADQRKVMFDIQKHKKNRKTESIGKPPNCKDPFPVDNKIEEFEVHNPRCKIDSIQACPQAVSTAKEVIKLSVNAEKRIVKLENNIATIMRYLWRLGSRVNINCVYYGGQTTYEKYNCIRCLKDERVHEGAEVSIDQCVNCTRYEPIIGQVYDIFNDGAVGLSQVLDDAQMSYSTMEEYSKFICAQEMQSELESGTMDAANIKTRNKSEIDFDLLWGKGFVMDWHPYPVELQKPHINWRQSINIAQPKGKLASYQGAAGNTGYGMTSIKSNRILANQALISKLPSSDMAYEVIAEAENFTNSKLDSLVQDLKGDVGKTIESQFKEIGLTKYNDKCLIGALMAVYDGGVADTIKKFKEVIDKMQAKGVDNEILAISFYNVDLVNLFGKDDGGVNHNGRY